MKIFDSLVIADRFANVDRRSDVCYDAMDGIEMAELDEVAVVRAVENLDIEIVIETEIDLANVMVAVAVDLNGLDVIQIAVGLNLLIDVMLNSH